LKLGLASLEQSADQCTMTGMFTMDVLFLGHYMKQFESIGTADCEEVLFIPGLKIDYMIPGNLSSK